MSKPVVGGYRLYSIDKLRRNIVVEVQDAIAALPLILILVLDHTEVRSNATASGQARSFAQLLAVGEGACPVRRKSSLRPMSVRRKIQVHIRAARVPVHAMTISSTASSFPLRYHCTWIAASTDQGVASIACDASVLSTRFQA